MNKKSDGIISLFFIFTITFFVIPKNIIFGGESNVSERQVYAHFLTWFKTKEFSGEWEMWKSDYKQAPHNPDKIFANGKRDLAVTSYPLTGAYDSCDADIMEYQFLLMKLSGIDGIIVDWDGRNINKYRHEALMNILPFLTKYDVKLIICFEEWCGYWPEGVYQTRSEQINAAKRELKWAHDNILEKPFYGTIKGKKPILVFRKKPDKWFNVNEWRILAEDIKGCEPALIFDIGAYRQFTSIAGGKYFWVGGFNPKTNCSDIEFCKKSYEYFFKVKNKDSENDIVIGGVTPGFDDTPVWGWGNLGRVAPRYNGERFRMTWEMTIKNDVAVAQIITWNDWNEGTQIEPCEKYGYKYLEMNKKFAAEFKGVEDNVPDKILRIPLKIYRARKDASSDKKTLDKISSAILNFEYGKAAELAEGI
jgi:hypothetical protein